ncbi:MAG: hypothetical protein HY606_14055 [Planctomycetes bacterium]|nr:hypothetical protein [Planctomycetota bacterium]
MNEKDKNYAKEYILDTFGENQCMKCEHFDDSTWHSCKAFPDQIPLDIFGEVHDHKKPFKGDNGIRFEPRKKELMWGNYGG